MKPTQEHINETIIRLCEFIKEHVDAANTEHLPQLIEATAKLIESTKDRGVF
ncbi:hypothetical protein MO973_19725 [Paenibacillus sp. TRM 82003]|nr:hypothetical protein [Paenibacillus sp. TRM 82003]